MKTIIALEGLLLAACFLGAFAIAAVTKDIKKASLLLYGFLIAWFVLFYLAIPGIRVFVLGKEAAANSFADTPMPMIFMIIAAIDCLIFAGVCLFARWLWRRIRPKKQHP
jgi:hypothetical protein